MLKLNVIILILLNTFFSNILAMENNNYTVTTSNNIDHRSWARGKVYYEYHPYLTIKNMRSTVFGHTPKAPYPTIDTSAQTPTLPLFNSDSPLIEILDSEIPEEIMQHIIVSHVMQCLHTNPNKPDISLLTTTAQLNKKWAASMLELHKQLIEQGAQLIKNTHYWYANYILNTSLSMAIADFNYNHRWYLYDELKIMTHMNNPYFIVNFSDYHSHLYSACFHQKYLVIKKLLQRNAIIESNDFIGCCPYMPQDVEKKGIACATLLLEKDPSLINKVSSFLYDTLLSMSARYGKNDMIQFLIDQKADVNLADPDGFTALHNAALNAQEKAWISDNPPNMVKTIQLLIAGGADPFKKINVGKHTDCDTYDLVKKFHTKDNSLTPFGQQLVKELRKSRAVERSQGTAHYKGTVSTVDKNT